MKTRLGQMIFNDGERSGRESVKRTMTVLYEKLQLAGRTAEFLQACRDENYRKQLMKEYGIK